MAGSRSVPSLCLGSIYPCWSTDGGDRLTYAGRQQLTTTPIEKRSSRISTLRKLKPRHPPRHLRRAGLLACQPARLPDRARLVPVRGHRSLPGPPEPRPAERSAQAPPAVRRRPEPMIGGPRGTSFGRRKCPSPARRNSLSASKISFPVLGEGLFRAGNVVPCPRTRTFSGLGSRWPGHDRYHFGPKMLFPEVSAGHFGHERDLSPARGTTFPMSKCSSPCSGNNIFGAGQEFP